jgi:hypothetical protein
MPFTNSFHAEFSRAVRLLQQKLEFEFELEFRESTPDPCHASENDSRLRQNGTGNQTWGSDADSGWDPWAGSVFCHAKLR